MNNWSSLARPQAYVIKKYMFDLLQERYPKHDELLDRISSQLITKSDIEGFGNLVSDIYEVAYTKCAADHSEALSKKGYKATIVPGSPEGKKIFNQSEKSG